VRLTTLRAAPNAEARIMDRPKYISNEAKVRGGGQKDAVDSL